MDRENFTFKEVSPDDYKNDVDEINQSNIFYFDILNMTFYPNKKNKIWK